MSAVNDSLMNMYHGMMDITYNSEAFYFQDYEAQGNTYRVFNYRLASYTDFLQPYTMEMRGIAWLIRIEGNAIPTPLLVSRPFEKFFNYLENPFTTGLDLSKAIRYEEKADGSLIATYYDIATNKLGLKSKQAFFSEQAVMASELLWSEPYHEFKKAIWDTVNAGYTVLMELCSPSNRIVLEYETTHLKVHGIRQNSTGTYLRKSDLHPSNPLYIAWVEGVDVDGLPEDFISSTVAKRGIEGYVVHGPWGRFKIKTEWYRTLHHLKDSVSTTKNLIEAILYERIDDVRAMFSTDTFTLNRIAQAESVVITMFNHIVKVVQEFYESNKTLSRKEFAIKGQAELKDYFSLGMNLYLGKEADYKAYCMKYQKEIFGLVEQNENREE